MMHAAFAEYTDRGQPSGALLESPDSLRAELAGGLRIALVRVDGTAAAMVKYRPDADGSIYFSRLSVSPASRGSGLAALLLTALRSTAHQAGRPGLSCCVRADETGNIALYEHLGMRVSGREDRASLTGAVLPVVLMVDRHGDSIPVCGESVGESG